MTNVLRDDGALSLYPRLQPDIKVHSFIELLESVCLFPCPLDIQYIQCIEAEVVGHSVIYNPWYPGDNDATKR